MFSFDDGSYRVFSCFEDVSLFDDADFYCSRSGVSGTEMRAIGVSLFSRVLVSQDELEYDNCRSLGPVEWMT